MTWRRGADNKDKGVVCDWGAPADNEDGGLASDDAGVATSDNDKELIEMKARKVDDEGKRAGPADEVERDGVDVAAGFSCDITANGAMMDAGKRL